MATFLLEIGTEELPAAYIPPALTQLDELTRARLQAERIDVDEVQIWGTPRRLTVYAAGVSDHQAPAVRTVRGPSAQSAFSANGSPLQPAIGFARSQGVAVNDLRVEQVDGGEYVFAVIRDEGRSTAELLPTIFTDLIRGIAFPKTMHWGTLPFRFARPIRWLVALWDDAVISCEIGEVRAGRDSRGHRFLAPHDIAISGPGDYVRLLEEHQVIVMPDQRRDAILLQLNEIARLANATVVDDGSLLETTTFLVEYPTAVRGDFEERFLDLPHEVLLQVLRREQSFFPLRDETSGLLLPAFIAVRNGDAAHLQTVREGYESVARAKLIDALFFFEQDRERSPEERIEDLHGIIFQERLGTMHEKVVRDEHLAGRIAGELGLPAEEIALAEHAALLSKTDLVTSMVIEHPELQGTMGRVYARLAGEPEAVAVAIGEQYAPRGANDPIPTTTIGRIVALADKLDTVVGCFAVGLIPTGSEDPYALRREAQGIVRILTEANYRLSLLNLLAFALGQLRITPAQPAEETLAALQSFFNQRMETLLAAQGIEPQVVRAVMAVSAGKPADDLRRARLIQSCLHEPGFETVARIATRLANISKRAASAVLNEELLVEPAERELYARYREVATRAEFFAARGEFAELPPLLETLAPAVDRFFDEVLVMAEDPALREARLALVTRLSDLFRQLGDLSQLGG